MPSRNRIKYYVEDGYYHLYNRGVNKNPIFLEDQDYFVFTSYLKEYLSPQVNPTELEIKMMQYTYLRKNYFGKIELIAYCLMPNHFHFIVKQAEPRAIVEFMQSFSARYTTYFNKHHDRIGPLYQDIYKGIFVSSDEYLLWLSRYIHRNPLELLSNSPLVSYPYSSYSSFLKTTPIWIHPEIITSEFKDYSSFVEGGSENCPDLLADYYLE